MRVIIMWLVLSLACGCSRASAQALPAINGNYLGAMTSSARDSLGVVPAGSLIFNSSTGKLNFYSGSSWEAVVSLP